VDISIRQAQGEEAEAGGSTLAMVTDWWRARALRDHVAARRAASGRKFETCEQMRPVFAELDAKGWNDWPPEPVLSPTA
jgi:hypothetical protein